MKTIVLTLALILAVSATALATNPYNVGDNTPVVGTLNIGATVNHVPIEIGINQITDGSHIELGGLYPGSSRTEWENDENRYVFEIAFAVGYGMKVSFGSPVRIDAIAGPEVTIATRWTLDNNGASSYGAIPGLATIPPCTLNCAESVLVGIEVTGLYVPAGAYVGERLWSITCTAEYYE